MYVFTSRALVSELKKPEWDFDLRSNPSKIELNLSTIKNMNLVRRFSDELNSHYVVLFSPIQVIVKLQRIIASMI
jgi:hypothetical protein